MKIIKPVFNLGIGRCGSTIFHHIMAKHPNVTWLSNISHNYPHKPQWNRWLMHAMNSDILERILMKKIRVREAFGFWDLYCKGFSRPFRDLRLDDLTPRNKSSVSNAISQNLTKKRNRFVTKLTGWPRIRYIRGIFEDAKFIHVVRDGRAVVNSMINVDFWWGWHGMSNWRWGDIPEPYYQEWLDTDQSFVAMAAIEWKMIMDAFEVAKAETPAQQYLEIRYEQLCDDPIAVYKDVLAFCELPWSQKFEKKILRFDLRNTNYKWQKQLTSQQQDIMQKIFSDHLVKYGYNI